MRPYPARNLTRRKRIFNYRQSGKNERRKCTWNFISTIIYLHDQIFKRTLNFSPAKVELFTLTCCIIY